MRNVEQQEKDALLKDLEDARQRFNTAKGDVERLRNQIAIANCPLSVGGTVPLTKDGKDFDGIVDMIRAKPDWAEAHSGQAVEWIPSGNRINKTTGEVGEWGFEISSDGSTQDRGRWRVKTLDEILGIK
jgi:hypothetical protein